MKFLVVFLVSLLSLLIVFTGYSFFQSPATISPSEKMNGVSFVAPPRKPQGNPFRKVEKVNANWVAIMPYAYGREAQPQIYHDVERQWWGEKTVGMIESIKQAKSCGLKVMVKPHIWVRGQGWTGDFTLKTDEEWEMWESEYEKYILPLAKVSDSLGVEVFCIGLELKHVVKARPQFWTELIEKVRQVYSGKLTYGGNWDNFEDVPFWDQLDYIGVHAYFPLSQEETPEVEQLLEAWKKPAERIKNLQKKYQKPILFTEFGYRSIDKAAGKQWELEDNWHYQGDANCEVQRRAFQAIFQTFWDEPWFAGGFIWKWYHKHDQSGGLDNSDYTPQNKPVEQVIKNWYGSRLAERK